MILALVLLALGIGCYSVKELQAHGKLRWMQHGNYIRAFWDEDSYLRKYKLTNEGTVIVAPQNWYYRFFKIKYKERFPLSATFLVAFTDGMHLMQFFFLLFISLSVALLIGFNWWTLLLVWSGIHIVHASVYRLLSR
jgi:hypothetical protein